MTEKPRHKLARVGIENLSLVEVVQILISSGSHKRSYVHIAREVTKIIKDPDQSSSVLYNRLLACRGVGQVKAMQLLCAIELSRRCQSSLPVPIQIKTTEQAYYQLASLARKRQEYFVALYLNARQELVYRRTVFIGGIDISLAQPREIFSYSFIKNAFTLILAHNHPSGNPEPSNDDIKTSQLIMQAARWVGIKVLDHLIIGRTGYVSLRHLGYLEVA